MDGGVGRGWFGGGCEGEFDGVAEDVEDVDGERWLVVGHLLAGFLVSQGFFGHDGDGPSPITSKGGRFEFSTIGLYVRFLIVLPDSPDSIEFAQFSVSRRVHALSSSIP